MTSLNKNKRTDAHSKRDENWRHPSTNTKKSDKKQRFIVSQQLNTGDLADSSGDDQVDECDASPCIIKNDRSKTRIVDWVQYDVCEEWLHTFCIGTEPSLEENICKFCA